MNDKALALMDHATAFIQAEGIKGAKRLRTSLTRGNQANMFFSNKAVNKKWLAYCEANNIQLDTELEF